ncbi:hypothetical protein AKO1_012646 [Acrasis kona]|uniref:Uncharacterized protein n=1 Tax=Acrasis kona TaxID=1008807 RepID=A0AAW2YVU9_9EUKA
MLRLRIRNTLLRIPKRFYSNIITQNDFKQVQKKPDSINTLPTQERMSDIFGGVPPRRNLNEIFDQMTEAEIAQLKSRFSDEQIIDLIQLKDYDSSYRPLSKNYYYFLMALSAFLVSLYAFDVHVKKLEKEVIELALSTLVIDRYLEVLNPPDFKRAKPGSVEEAYRKTMITALSELTSMVKKPRHLEYFYKNNVVEKVLDLFSQTSVPTICDQVILLLSEMSNHTCLAEQIVDLGGVDMIHNFFMDGLTASPDGRGLSVVKGNRTIRPNLHNGGIRLVNVVETCIVDPCLLPKIKAQHPQFFSYVITLLNLPNEGLSNKAVKMIGMLSDNHLEQVQRIRDENIKDWRSLVLEPDHRFIKNVEFYVTNQSTNLNDEQRSKLASHLSRFRVQPDNEQVADRLVHPDDSLPRRFFEKFVAEGYLDRYYLQELAQTGYRIVFFIITYHYMNVRFANKLISASQVRRLVKIGMSLSALNLFVVDGVNILLYSNRSKYCKQQLDLRLRKGHENSLYTPEAIEYGERLLSILSWIIVITNGIIARYTVAPVLLYYLLESVDRIRVEEGAPYTYSDIISFLMEKNRYDMLQRERRFTEMKEDEEYFSKQ